MRNEFEELINEEELFEEMETERLERHKKFWDDIFKNSRSPKHIVVNGTCYWVDDECSDSVFRGHGGMEFLIERNDGYVFSTTNLWCRGKVPDDYRNILPDNAKFLSRDAYEFELALV